MNLDIRYPLGMIFLAIGVVLVVFGAITHGSAIYATSMGMDINLIWGVVMIVFGAIMFGLAKRAAMNPGPPVAIDETAARRPPTH
jgi:hypothetical protein